jgi:hypothetical protein
VAHRPYPPTSREPRRQRCLGTRSYAARDWHGECVAQSTPQNPLIRDRWAVTSSHQFRHCFTITITLLLFFSTFQNSLRRGRSLSLPIPLPLLQPISWLPYPLGEGRGVSIITTVHIYIIVLVCHSPLSQGSSIGLISARQLIGCCWPPWRMSCVFFFSKKKAYVM